MEQSYKEKYEQAIERLKQWDREKLINKACDWLKRNGSYYIGFEQGQPCITEEFIKSLKKYMDGKDEMRKV